MWWAYISMCEHMMKVHLMKNVVVMCLALHVYICEYVSACVHVCFCVPCVGGIVNFLAFDVYLPMGLWQTLIPN